MGSQLHLKGGCLFRGGAYERERGIRLQRVRRFSRGERAFSWGEFSY